MHSNAVHLYTPLPTGRVCCAPAPSGLGVVGRQDHKITRWCFAMCLQVGARGPLLCRPRQPKRSTAQNANQPHHSVAQPPPEARRAAQRLVALPGTELTNLSSSSVLVGAVALCPYASLSWAATVHGVVRHRHTLRYVLSLFRNYLPLGLISNLLYCVSGSSSSPSQPPWRPTPAMSA